MKPFTEITWDTILKYHLTDDIPDALRLEATALVKRVSGKTLPKSWDWNWTVPPKGGPYTGALPTRLRNWLYKEHQIRLERNVLADLGEQLRRMTPVRQTYYVDFTRSFKWRCGNFGDSDSCFLSYKNGVFTPVMDRNNGFAIRTWRDDGKTGDGRCFGFWQRGCYLLVNSRRHPLQVFGRLLALHLGGAESRLIHGGNCNEDTHSYMYVDGGFYDPGWGSYYDGKKGTILAIGEPEDLAALPEVIDLNLLPSDRS